MPNNIRLLVAGLSFATLLLPIPGFGASSHADHEWCGSHPAVGDIVAAKHQFLERRAAQQRESNDLFAKNGSLTLSQSAPQVTQDGDVLVIVDDGTLIQEPNPSDASDKGYRIQKKRKKLKLSKKPGGVGSNVGQAVSLGDDDTVKIDFEKGFKFKFFGNTYTSAYINSDGNLTFGEGDSASTSRDLGRTLNGPARVMAYFTDLDPSSSGEVFVNFISKGKMTVTWRDVVEFGGFTPNTFQVTLFKKGHVEFRFGQMNAATGIVGVSPGGGAAVSLLDFSMDAPTTLGEQAIAEVFGTEQIVDESAIASVFYDNYPDDVEQIVVFYDFVLPLLGGDAVAYHFTTKNDVKGIGYKNSRSSETFDNSGSMGSDGVLEGFANMGYVHKYNDNLNRLRGTITNLGVLVHELGHQWLSRVYFKKTGQPTNPGLQENGGHWSFNAHTSASFMQGNDIDDLGGGNFVTRQTDAIFSEMDLYILGLLPSDQVPDFFYVKNSSQASGQLPQFNVNMFGERENVGVADVIREEGPRTPSVDDSQKTFRVAMVLLVPSGQSASRRSIDKVQDFADKLVKEWRDQTRGLGGFDPSLTAK